MDTPNPAICSTALAAGRTLRLVLLEDNANDAEMIGRALRQAQLPHWLCRAATRKGYALALRHVAPDAILVDCVVPGYDGRSAVQLARDCCPRTPVIVVTGVPAAAALTHLPKGVSGYVAKDGLTHLADTILHAVGVLP